MLLPLLKIIFHIHYLLLVKTYFKMQVKSCFLYENFPEYYIISVPKTFWLYPTFASVNFNTHSFSGYNLL